MRTPIYKNYRIFYEGNFLEDISATSKKNVLEYIHDTYKQQWDERINYKYFKLKLFDVELWDTIAI